MWCKLDHLVSWGSRNRIALLGSLIMCCFLVVEPLAAYEAADAKPDDHESDLHEESSDRLRLATYRTWLFRSFLPDADDDADTLGLEFNSTWGWGNYDVLNISYIEVADYPVQIPGLPPGNPVPDPEGTAFADTGINDLLTAFLFSKKGGHHGPHHFGYGFSAQLPTGSGKTLSSGKYSLGPAIEYEYDAGGRFYAAFVALQLWSVAGDSDRKDVNMMMIKPMITWDFNERWKAVYMPYGVSVYWNKPSSQAVYLPLGGGIQRQFNLGPRPSAFSLQAFKNVVRPDEGVKYDVRLMLEINF
jgi:hypothetical protein